MPKIKILKDEIIWNGRFIRLIKRHYLGLKGEKKYWEMIKRSPERHKIVSIIGITPKKEIILIKIYRIPIKSYVLETVMGLTDQKGESPAEAAKRELLEETGYLAKKVVRLIESPHNSGLSAWPVIFYAGLDAKKIKEPKLETSEDIKVVKIPARKIISYLLNPKIKVDIKIFGVLLLLAQKGMIKL